MLTVVHSILRPVILSGSGGRKLWILKVIKRKMRTKGKRREIAAVIACCVLRQVREMMMKS